MGLVTCSKCNKVYDYEKYNGICPKCARYNNENTAAEEHQGYHDRYDDGYRHTAQDNHHSYHQRYDENQHPHKHQLAGVQETLKEVMGAEHKVTVEENAKKQNNKDKTRKVLPALILIFVLSNLFLPFFGIVFLPVMIGVIFYLLHKNSKR